MALFDSIHIVINSAGVAWSDFTASPKKVHSSKLFSDVFKINVLGTFNVCKFAAQLMMKQPSVDDTKEKGVIINVASILGLEGQKGTVAYAASKAAIIGMTLPMARDLGKYGITVMTLAPGLIETPMSQITIQSFGKLLSDQTCLGRLGKPKELAELCQGIIENGYGERGCLED